MDGIHSIKELEGRLFGKTVMLRAGLNVPIENDEVTNDFRVKASLPTIEFLMKEGAKIIIISHIKRGKESSEQVNEVQSKTKKMDEKKEEEIRKEKERQDKEKQDKEEREKKERKAEEEREQKKN